ncbi:MAG: hypothetical protein U5L72_08540 [Bacteroidales bacterium]|nr:hypothetical protein [Bacteroidales bacterium]
MEKGGWAFTDDRLILNVVLRDVNYKPVQNTAWAIILIMIDSQGSGFQAVEGISYDVVFSRVK